MVLPLNLVGSLGGTQGVMSEGRKASEQTLDGGCTPLAVRVTLLRALCPLTRASFPQPRTLPARSCCALADLLKERRHD